jgi:hypothetical protein
MLTRAMGASEVGRERKSVRADRGRRNVDTGMVMEREVVVVVLVLVAGISTVSSESSLVTLASHPLSSSSSSSSSSTTITVNGWQPSASTKPSSVAAATVSAPKVSSASLRSCVRAQDEASAGSAGAGAGAGGEISASS